MNLAMAERLPPDTLHAEGLAWPLGAPEAQHARQVEGPAPLLGLAAVETRLGAHGFGPFTSSLRAGERVAILGPSGAGKSTLLKLMSGERAARRGELRFDGVPCARWALPALARRRAVLPQSFAVAFGLPVELVVSLGRVARDHDPGQTGIVASALALAQAAHLAGRRFDTLSGGEQARVQLARVFAQVWDEREALVLVDEPLAALDPGLQFELMDALQVFSAERGHALVAVLHDLNQALSGFERLWLMQQGQLIADLPANRHAVGALERLYGIGLRCVDGSDGGFAVITQRCVASNAEVPA